MKSGLIGAAVGIGGVLIYDHVSNGEIAWARAGGIALLTLVIVFVIAKVKK